MLDAVREAQAGGASHEQLEPILALQRKAMWRLDYISSENSRGFHAPQEAARILGESIDYSRQAQAGALRLRVTEPPDMSPLPAAEPVYGVSDREDPAGSSPRRPAPSATPPAGSASSAPSGSPPGTKR
jgi:nitrite reductase (cytochrome c-552)